MNSRNFIAKGFTFLTSLLFITYLATPSFAAPARSGSDFHSPFSLYSQPVFSDFDGDNKLDTVEFSSIGTEKHIHVTLGNFVWKSLSFDSGVQDRGRLMSDDFDRDGDADLI